MPETSVPDPTLLAEDFRRAMRCLATTVAIVATEVSGRRVGMTATAVTSVSADPPSLLVCVRRTASLHEVLTIGHRFTVNLLRLGQHEISRVFSAPPIGESRFATGDWASADGLPWLKDAQANFGCIVESTLGYATHTIFVGRVFRTVVTSPIEPLIYQDGNYWRSLPV
jgi:flavin reductase (DIM6/NTAB) family NADH-FMN oxidoreductase RutF